MVERTGLEYQHTRDRIEGSNPSLSARLYKLKSVEEHHDILGRHVDNLMKFYAPYFKESDNDFKGSTAHYMKYNAITLLRGLPHYNVVFDELLSIICEYYEGDSETIFVKAWINYHSEDELLDWHDHQSLFHGYLSIRPHDTVTEFKDGKIENEVGSMYIGPGNLKHRVVSNTKFTEKRITIAFDVNDKIEELSNPFIQVPILKTL